MLTELFTSRTRINLFLKLFLNPEVSCYLRELAREFNLSPNALKEELDNLSQRGYLDKQQRGQSIFYKANTSHPFFPEISSIVKKHYGIDKIVEQILNDIGNVNAIYALDDYAEGRDSGLIDILIVGDVKMDVIQKLRPSLEKEIKRKIRIMVMNAQEFAESREMLLKRPNWRIL
jgi:DNA-binding transcriptional ArsR family regulator